MSKVEITRKYLGEPYPAELSSIAERARRNLLVGCSIAFTLLFGQLKLSETSTIFGVSFENLTNDVFYIGLLIFLAYQLLHFTWHAWDAFAYWRVRLTGSRVVFQTASRFGSGDEYDSPDDPKQSSLNNWWLEQRRNMESVAQLISQLESECKSGNLLLGDDQKKHSKFEKDISSLNSTLEKTQKIVVSERIPESLKSFENWYALMVASQSLRWFIIEAGLPIALGLASVIWLCCVVT